MPKFKEILRWTDRHFSRIVVFIIVFYTVGIIGLSIPAGKPFFIRLTPFALLLSSSVVFLFHRDHWLKAWLVFALIYFCGLITEIIGVQTGLIFGDYEYGTGLGIKIFDTPLIIGLNWLLLVYLAVSLTSRLHIIPPFQIIMAAILLLAYDLILEKIAPKLDMWRWENGLVPPQNYLAWFLLALTLAAILKYSGINVKNRMAPVILICQTLFFAIILLIFK